MRWSRRFKALASFITLSTGKVTSHARCGPAEEPGGRIVGRGLEANVGAIARELGGVDLDARPAVAVVVDELARHSIVDPDAQRDRSMDASTFRLVVDAPADQETLAERHVGEGHADWIGAGRVLPDATPRLKLEVCKTVAPTQSQGRRGSQTKRSVGVIGP